MKALLLNVNGCEWLPECPVDYTGYPKSSFTHNDLLYVGDGHMWSSKGSPVLPEYAIYKATVAYLGERKSA